MLLEVHKNTTHETIVFVIADKFTRVLIIATQYKPLVFSDMYSSDISPQSLGQVTFACLWFRVGIPWATPKMLC